MEEKLQEVRSKITPHLQEINIIVDNVECVEEGSYKFLRITLDKVNGIDLDTIVEATNIINPIIDELDFVDESFILDVISKEKGSGNNG